MKPLPLTSYRVMTTNEYRKSLSKKTKQEIIEECIVQYSQKIELMRQMNQLANNPSNVTVISANEFERTLVKKTRPALIEECVVQFIEKSKRFAQRNFLEREIEFGGMKERKEKANQEATHRHHVLADWYRYNAGEIATPPSKKIYGAGKKYQAFLKLKTKPMTLDDWEIVIALVDGRALLQAIEELPSLYSKQLSK